MKTYLKIYNLLLCIEWFFVLLLFINSCRINGWLSMAILYDDQWMMLLNICQGAAILEIFHALFKWVSSPVQTTIIQVSSRLIVLYLVNQLAPEQYITIAGITGLHLIIIAWSITEIVRYSFYFCGLIGKEPKFLLFLRYSLFIVLYPIGVAGELLIIISYMKQDGFKLDATDIILGSIALSYLVGFPKMFGYMVAQRKKKLI